MGKRVSLVRSCVLAYVRTAFGGPQERRNASKKNALPEILKHYFVLSVTKRNEKNSTSFQCSTSWHSGEASLVSQIQEISDIIYFVEDTDNSGTEEVEIKLCVRRVVACAKVFKGENQDLHSDLYHKIFLRILNFQISKPTAQSQKVAKSPD